MRVATSPCPGGTSEKARVRKLSPADPNWRIPSEMFARATPWSIACRCLSDGPTVLIGSWNLEISTTGRYKSWVTLRGHLLGVPALRPSWAYRSAARRSLPKLAAVPNNSSLSDGDPFLFQGRAPVSVVPTWKATKMALLQSTVVTPPAEIWHACTTERDATARETLRVGFVPSFVRLSLFRFRCRNRSRPPKRAKNSVPSEIVRIRAPVQSFMRVPLFPKAVDLHRS